MKTIALLLLMSISIIASTQYRTPNMIVDKSELYCTDYYGEHIFTYPTGDIIDGERAANYCSYNKSTVIKKMKYISSHKNKQHDALMKSILGYILFALVVLLFWLILEMFGFYEFICKLYARLKGNKQ